MQSNATSQPASTAALDMLSSNRRKAPITAGGVFVTSTALVDGARRALGPVGAFLPNIPLTSAPPVELQRQAVRRLERAGYRAAWNNEGVGGKDGFVQLALLLAATERLVFGSAVANIWARPPETAHGAAALLAEAYPGRFVLGLGVGYPFQADGVGRRYGSPLETIRDYLERMAAPQPMTQVPYVAYARIVAANGPKMLAQAGQIADGALPTLVPPEYTARAREVLGPDKLLVIGLTVAVDDDRERAKATAKQFMSATVGRPGSPYAANLARLGYSADELSTATDRAVDAVLGYGGPAAIAAKVREHLDAGADHVRLATIVPDFSTGIDQLERLAPALTG
jgi:probable F420-dependent oxidoreductase